MKNAILQIYKRVIELASFLGFARGRKILKATLCKEERLSGFTGSIRVWK